MDKRLGREEIRRRALRAAAAVAVSVVVGGCSAQDVAVHGAAVADGEGATQDAALGQADGGYDAALGQDTALAQDSQPAAKDVAGADSADAGKKCVRGEDWKAYADCCAAVNWDYDQGCMAWGPPMPPEVV